MAAKQITVWGQNRPGNLAKIAGVVGAAALNITGLFASDVKGKSAVRLLVGNAARATAALRKAGYRVTQEPVLVLSLANKPLQLARVTRRLAKARVNVGYAYATAAFGARRACIVLGVSSAAAARRALR
jgi:hypothetical protein